MSESTTNHLKNKALYSNKYIWLSLTKKTKKTIPSPGILAFMLLLFTPGGFLLTARHEDHENQSLKSLKDHFKRNDRILGLKETIRQDRITRNTRFTLHCLSYFSISLFISACFSFLLTPTSDSC
jgi:hypothetical protein